MKKTNEPIETNAEPEEKKFSLFDLLNIAETIKTPWKDLTEEQKQQGVSVGVAGTLPEDYTYTITPTTDWYAVCTTVNPPIMGENGAPIVVAGEYSVGLTIANGLNPEAADFKAFVVRFDVSD